MPNIYACIPILDELENISSLLNCLYSQSKKAEKIICCVNQPKSFISDPEKKHIYKNNQETIEILKKNEDIVIIDRSSHEYAWTEKKQGVGSARKLCFEMACSLANDEDTIISLDADTYYDENYFEEISNLISDNKNFSAAALPYYHPLNNDLQQNIALLHYEIYMRYYLLNLLLIDSPYAFTALGSAIAFSVKNYKKIKGISEKLAGEDFYLLQKFRKQAPLLLHSQSIVKPSSRISTRVPFGTGPAINEKENCDFNKYPLFSVSSFAKIKSFYNQLDELYDNDFTTSIDDFFIDTFGNKDFIRLIRQNSANKEKFIKAMHQKIDGLKILQCLRYYHNKDIEYDGYQNLHLFIKKYYPSISFLDDFTTFADDNSKIEKLSRLRDLLFKIELEEREKKQMKLV